MTSKKWDIIKEVIGFPKPNTHVLPKKLIVNDVEILEKKEIAKHFNKYFVNKKLTAFFLEIIQL